MDDFNREALSITVAKSITSERVITELDRVIEWRGTPKSIRVDNGGVHRRGVERLLQTSRQRHRTLVHPKGQAQSERLHRAVQPHLP